MPWQEFAGQGAADHCLHLVLQAGERRPDSDLLADR